MASERDKRNIADLVEKAFGLEPLIVRRLLQTTGPGCWEAILEPLDEFHTQLYIVTYDGGDVMEVDVYDKIASNKIVQN